MEAGTEGAGFPAKVGNSPPIEVWMVRAVTRSGRPPGRPKGSKRRLAGELRRREGSVGEVGSSRGGWGEGWSEKDRSEF
jgi:hypothetical protein